MKWGFAQSAQRCALQRTQHSSKGALKTYINTKGARAQSLVLPSENEGLILAHPVRGFASMVQRKGLAMVRLK